MVSFKYSSSRKHIMADNKIQMPQSGGGLVRYSEEVKSNFTLSPYTVMGLIVLVSVVLMFLQYI
jgi:preprotein translocase subunit Sec61beta